MKFGEFKSNNQRFTFLVASALLWLATATFAQNADLLIGTGVAEISGNNANQAVMLAKKRAMADLAGQIKVRVHSEFSQSVRENNQGIDEYTRSKINLISDMEIEGVRFQIDRKPTFVEARALLDKAKARKIYFEKCKNLTSEIDQRLANADQFLKANQPQIALPELLKASHLMSAFEQDKLIYFALGGERNDNLQLHLTHAAIDQKIAGLLNRKIRSFDDALNSLAFQLAKQMPQQVRIKIFPFQFEDRNYGSSFSEYLRQELQNSLPKFWQPSAGKVGDALLINGSYWLHPKTMVVLAQIQNKQGYVTGNARVEIPKSVIDALGVAYTPANFEQAQNDAPIFDDSAIAYGDLNMRVWTNHGTRDLLYKEGERMKIYVRVSSPAYIRCIYHLANGLRTPLVDNFYVDATMVNKPVEVNKGFDLICAPPFGVERLQIFASTRKFPKLQTKEVVIKGQKYRVLAEPIQKFVTNTRGFIKHPSGFLPTKPVKSAERVITVTTIPNTIQ